MTLCGMSDMQNVEFFAHTRPNTPPSLWQPLSDHLRNVSALAKASVTGCGLGIWAEVAGRWHDIGKASDAFQRHIGADSEASTETVHGRVDHSTAGAQHAYRTLEALGLPLAYVIAGHHAGLPNWYDESDAHLKGRLEKEIPDWRACPQDLLHAPELTARSFPFQPHPTHLGMQVFLFTRMLFSALVDADFLDTEAYMDPSRAGRNAPIGGRWSRCNRASTRT